MRYIEICKLLDLQLTKNQFVTSFTKDSWEKHIAADKAEWSKKELLVANGPYMSTFLEATKGLGISWSNIAGGALSVIKLTQCFYIQNFQICLKH